jgi:hypothetical protein
MEMASKAIGRLAMAGDTFTAEYVEFEVKRALEWLGADRNEGRRHAAVSACREKHSQVWGVVVHDGSPFASIRDYPRKSWVLLGQGSRL